MRGKYGVRRPPEKETGSMEMSSPADLCPWRLLRTRKTREKKSIFPGKKRNSPAKS